MIISPNSLEFRLRRNNLRRRQIVTGEVETRFFSWSIPGNDSMCPADKQQLVEYHTGQASLYSRRAESRSYSVDEQRGFHLISASHTERAIELQAMDDFELDRELSRTLQQCEMDWEFCRSTHSRQLSEIDARLNAIRGRLRGLRLDPSPPS